MPIGSSKLLQTSQPALFVSVSFHRPLSAYVLSWNVRRERPVLCPGRQEWERGIKEVREVTEAPWHGLQSACSTWLSDAIAYVRIMMYMQMQNHSLYMHIIFVHVGTIGSCQGCLCLRWGRCSEPVFAVSALGSLSLRCSDFWGSRLCVARRWG